MESQGNLVDRVRTKGHSLRRELDVGAAMG